MPEKRLKRGAVKKPRIVVIAPGEPVEYFGLLWDGIRSAAAEITSLGVSVEYFLTPCHDVARQKEILTELKRFAPDAIAIVPRHTNALDEAIQALAAHGTSIVTFNADAPQSGRCSYVGPDARRSGELAAEVLTKLMGGGRNVISFSGPLETEHLAARYEGFLAGLAHWRSDTSVVTRHDGIGDLGVDASTLLRQHPDVAGIYVGNARAYEIGAALERAGLHIPCVGFDNTEAVRPFLRKNLVSAVIDQNAYQQGYLAVQRAYEALSGQALLPRSTVIPSTVVFASNASEAANTDTLNEAFEQLVRRRTARLHSYQEMLQEANGQLLHLAETDDLTGLFNRRRFERLLEERVRHCSAACPLSLLMIDVNEFKTYNDSHGHHTGDEALRLLSAILSRQIRDTDYCARVGGDEFCILLPDTDEALAWNFRDRLHRAVAEAVVPAGSGSVSIRVSIGSATGPGQGRNPHDLMRAADQDMYRQKRQVRLGRAVTCGADGSSQSPVRQ